MEMRDVVAPVKVVVDVNLEMTQMRERSACRATAPLACRKEM